MVDPKDQWAIHIEVTNACTRKCSNCTRFVAHVREPFFISLDDYAVAVNALKDFPTESRIPQHAEVNCVGIMGGEPLLHPRFGELCEILKSEVPDRHNRGLWTGLDWHGSQYASLIRETFYYVNPNLHDTEVRHTPILVAIKDVVKDEAVRAKLIDNCWLQSRWSSSVTPKGFFFCEIAGAMDLLFDGPGGKPVVPGCWNRPISDFRDQIDLWCPRCGVPMNLKGRLDIDEIDDISDTNLRDLQDSPRIKEGRFVVLDHESRGVTKSPWKYMDKSWNP